MYDFKSCLEKTEEVGFVEEIVHSLIYATGIPGAKLYELVVFESGDLGQVFSIERERTQVLLLSAENIRVGMRIARTDEPLKIPVSQKLGGRMFDPLLRPIDGGVALDFTESIPISGDPPKLTDRKDVVRPLETGVAMVDMVVPLSMGQRELVIGDRKTGKTEFLLQTIVTQARRGTTCIYAIIGQKKVEIQRLFEFFQKAGIADNTVIIASNSSAPAGLIFETPYTAMTVAESLMKGGRDILVILDDMTTHARIYREISLLARKFPGRGAYPGDIFHIHARLLERSGSFKEGTITSLPVAESTLGDLSGYLQTNLMAMTDGHIFFDISLYNQGKRPAINPFLSVTRVGHQSQTALEVDVSRELLSFLVTYERMKQFLHFGAEVGKTVRNILNLGERIDVFLDQKESLSIPITVNIFVLAVVWSGVWNEVSLDKVRINIDKLRLTYTEDKAFRAKVNDIVAGSSKFSDLINAFRRDQSVVSSKL